MQKDLDPLPLDLWFERIEAIANGQLATTENGLRHAFHLLQLTPRECRPRDYWLLNEKSYEQLLDSGQLETAAKRLVEAPTLTVTAISSDEHVEVALRCQATGRTVFGRGDSAAAAILQAWANCLLGLRTELGASGFNRALEA